MRDWESEFEQFAKSVKVESCPDFALLCTYRGPIARQLDSQARIKSELRDEDSSVVSGGLKLEEY